MSHLMILLLLFANAWANPDLLTGSRTTVGRFFFLRSVDCRTIFYEPKAYVFEKERSSVVRGGGLVRFYISLAPLSLEPDGTERAQVLEWSRVAGGCDADPEIIPYPAHLSDLAPPKILGKIEVPFSSIDRLDGKRLVFRMNVVDKPAAVDNVLEVLQEFRPKVTMQIFNEEFVGRSTILAEYSGAAKFLKKYFEEKTCTIKESEDWRGRKSSKERCDFIPRVAVMLDTAEMKSVIQIVDEFPEDADPKVIADLRARLLSRLAISTFTITSQAKIGDMLRLELGNLEKTAAGHYEDSITLTQLVSDSYGGQIEIKNIHELKMRLK